MHRAPGVAADQSIGSCYSGAAHHVHTAVTSPIGSGIDALNVLTGIVQIEGF